jgi:glycosyltransferase involved in cell wall biosynthesis
LVDRDIEAWLAFNERFLRGAERILAPSRDTADRYERRLGLSGIEVAPHPEPAPPPARPPAPPPAPRRAARVGAGAVAGLLNIAVVGAIGQQKGFEVLVRLAEHAMKGRLPLLLSVVGYTMADDEIARLPNVRVTGRFEAGELGPRLDALQPDFVFLSSVWPETYSFVLSEVWDAGYPVVSFDFGAPAERIRAAEGGLVIPPTRDAGALYAALAEAKEALAGVRAPARPRAETQTLEAYYRPRPTAEPAKRGALVATPP